MDRRSNNSNNRFSRPNNNSNNNNGRDSYRPAPHPIKVDREKVCYFFCFLNSSLVYISFYLANYLIIILIQSLIN